MTASYAVFVGHIASDVGWSSASTIVLGCVVAFVALLALEHGYVEHGRLPSRSLRKPLACLLAVALTALIAPTPGFAQSPVGPIGLPDLISDPPFIWFNKNVRTQDDTTIRVMAFDGYLHNVGEGALHLTGNPQLADGIEQLVYDGEDWESVATPTVRFETDDGHNHFHLMRAVDYNLWDEGRNEIVSPASKVGFCLIDTEQIEEDFEAFYAIEDSNYCGVDSPDATELTMGITPGWRDTYASNVTFQWVDVSAVPPGRYWVSARTDPNDEIVESNEDNNDTVFSMNRWEVDGFVARDVSATPGSPIRLETSDFGIVGQPAFVIVDGPRHGSLDVPIGVDLLDDQVRYVPGVGYDGEDSFTYYAHDTTSGFPTTPVQATVTIRAEAEAEAEGGAPPLPESGETVDVGYPGSASLTLHQPVALLPDLQGPGDGDEPAWYGADMPPGLTVDREAGEISGVPTEAGTYESTIHLVSGDSHRTATVEFIVAHADVPQLQPTNHFSTASSRTLAMYLGTGGPDSSYEGTGLPAGTQITSNLPILGGTPEELGDFDIVINEITDGAVTASVEFTWTVKPSAEPAFVL